MAVVWAEGDGRSGMGEMRWAEGAGKGGMSEMRKDRVMGLRIMLDTKPYGKQNLVRPGKCSNAIDL